MGNAPGTCTPLPDTLTSLAGGLGPQGSTRVPAPPPACRFDGSPKRRVLAPDPRGPALTPASGARGLPGHPLLTGPHLWTLMQRAHRAAKSDLGPPWDPTAVGGWGRQRRRGAQDHRGTYSF